MNSLFVLLAFVACLVSSHPRHHHYHPVHSHSHGTPFGPTTLPSVYVAQLQFRLPYMSFTETLDAYVDTTNSLMKLEYFGGMDTYIFSGKDNSTSYSIVPVYTTLTCLSQQAQGPSQLQSLFPDLAKFTANGTEVVSIPVANSDKLITKNCNVWTYVAGTVVNASTAGGESVLPDAEGYSGIYYMYFDASTNAPVAFRSEGHNVVLGGSHTDEYWLDYIQITPFESANAEWFNPPKGMVCHDSTQPFGPTSLMGGDLFRSNPVHDIHMMFPEGHSRRMDVFSAWSGAYGKTYDSKIEEKKRSAIFHSNLRYINSGNRRGKSYIMNVNHFADTTITERAQMKGRSADIADPPGPNGDPGAVCETYVASGKPIPDSVDWRSQSLGGTQSEPGLVFPAKDQGTCGSCWSFGFTGTIEGQVAKSTGKLVKLSEQNILDCSWGYGNAACGGGQDFLGFAWLLQQNGGSLASDDSYGGYLNQNGFCHYSLKDKLTTNPFNGQPVVEGAKIAKCFHVTAQWNSTTPIMPDKEATAILNDAIYNVGPISVSIDATVPDFYFYHSGYYYNPACQSSLSDLDHTVLAVGYTTFQGQTYTIVRNSWSSHWGMNGFVYMSQENNNCGVATAPAFVTVY